MKRATGRVLVLVALALMGGITGLCGLLYWHEARQIKARLSEREAMQVGLQAYQLRSELAQSVADLQIMADGDGLRAYLASGRREDLERAAHRAEVLSRLQNDYDQIRYLDGDGREVLRINRGGIRARDADLQDKSDRDYFQKTALLGPGKLYLSAFDLNVENGRVEEPFKPMLRLAMPVLDGAGRPRGVYVINCRGDSLLARLEELARQNAHRVRLLNSGGYWLKAAEPGREWGFQLPERAAYTLARTAPELWNRIRHEPAGQTRFDGGLFSWQRIPITDLHGRSGGGVGIVAEEAFLVVASAVSADEWNALFGGLRRIFLIVTPSLLLLVAVGAGVQQARDQARRALRRSEQSLAVTLNSIGDAVLATDTTGRITLLNPVAERLTGWALAEARGRPVAEVFHIINEQTRARAPIPVDDVLATGEIKGLANHTALVARDGTERPIEDSAAPILDSARRVLGVVLVFRDVTEARRAREELDGFFELSIDFLCISNRDGYFKRVSPAVTAILGWSTKEFLAMPYLEQVHPDDRKATEREVERQMVHGEKVFRFENRYRHKDGSWRTLSWRSAPHGDLMYATARDVTEIRRAEAEVHALNRVLKQHAAQLEATNKELESFSYSVSHDLRAPLRHVQGYVEMLARETGGGLSPKAQRYLQTIAAAGHEMGQLIDDLLAFSRMSRMELSEAEVDPAPLIAEVRHRLEAETTGRDVRWTVGALPRIRADATMLRQVFANLLGNAVKYTRRCPVAEIEIGCDGYEEDRPVFHVRDNGAGFDMKYADKLFGVFQRLHRADEFEGTGIGLATVHRIIGRHGGRIWAESRLGAGTTFRFTLPPAAADQS